MRILFIAISCLVLNLGNTYAQKKRVAKTQQEVLEDGEHGAVQLEDELSVSNPKDSLLQDTEDEGSELAALKYQDRPHPRALDSLWMIELYGSGLYDTIYTDISTLEYDQEYEVDLPTDTLKHRLALLNQKTPFNIAYNPALESVIKMFLKKRRKNLTRMMALSKFYFPLFEEHLDRFDMPLEIKYLAVVESALNPRAKSRVGATGLWQFMFTTGKMYGLDVSSYVDERSDPIKSTVAACKYLSKLYQIFGDWDLALAAYNSGPGNVTKAIRRSGGYQNYWNLRPYLPRETAGYVPSFLATMYIFEYAKEHGFEEFHPKVPFMETDTVRVKKMITFDQISEALDVDMETLQFFNPSYKLDVVPVVKGENYVLRLPIRDMGTFVANEDTIYAIAEKEMQKVEKPLPELVQANTQIRHRVKSGEFLGRIAEKYGVRVSDIKRWNGLRNNNIRAGQRLLIYPGKPSAAVAKASSATSGVKTYTVRQGDSLWSIAKKHPGISVENIKDWNDISGNTLKPGTKLKLCNC